jgi:type IV pilus assembly protein PilM
MGDESVWKKEISFGRKPKERKEPAAETSETPEATDGEESGSLWKKEISLGRKSKPAEDAPVEDTVEEEETPMVERLASFTRTPDPQPEPVAEAEAVEEPAAEEQVDVTPDAPASPELAWKREVSFNVTPPEDSAEIVEPPASVEPVAEEPIAGIEAAPADSAPQELASQREVSFNVTPPGDSAEVVEPPAPVEPVAELLDATPAELAPQELAWKREVSFNVAPEDTEIAEPPASVEPVAEEPPLLEPVADEPAAVETWSAAPQLPPAPEPEAEVAAAPVAVPVPAPAPGIHAPVSAAELPPLEEEETKSVPFWKKELSLGGGKKEKPAKKESAAEKSVPFWKKEIGGKKRDKAPKQVEPVAAEHAEAAEKKVPFWKKEIGGKKREQTPKQTQVVAAQQPETAEKKVPFWKKEIGGKKREQAPTQTEAVATEQTEVIEKSVPFWKKDIGGKKGAKARKQPKAGRAPKVKGTKAPKVPRVKAERGSKGGKRIVGLKIGASQLAAARVSNNGTAELQQVAREPLAPGIVVGGELRDPDALAEALKDFFTRNGLPRKGVRLGIANNRIGVRTFEVAGIEDPKQLSNAIRFKAQEALPIPIDEAVLDYHVIGEGRDEQGQPTKRILLVVAYRELIDRYVDACRKAGIVLNGIDLEAFALLRALHPPKGSAGDEPPAAVVAVAIGHERSTFAVSDGVVCEFTRVVEWGGAALNVAIARALDAAPSEVEGVKRALALSDEVVPEGLTADQAKAAREAMRRAIQTFARELVSSLQYYQNQPGSLGIGEIIVTGGTAHLTGLSAELEQLIGVRVRVGDPLARMKVSKKIGEPEQVGSFAVAIGLGIEDD